MTQKIKIIVADKHDLFRKSLIALLNTYSEFDIVGEAPDGRELISLLKQQEVNIVLMDSTMPGMDGNATLQVIHRRFPEVRVIVLSDVMDARSQTDFMANGANSYLSKSCDVNTLYEAIHKVKKEGFFFSDSISKALLDSFLKEKQHNTVSSAVIFSSRETEVLKQICDGRTNKEIADILHLSSSTIDFYKTKIYNKTKCNNVARLIKFALKNGYVSLQ